MNPPDATSSLRNHGRKDQALMEDVTEIFKDLLGPGWKNEGTDETR